MKNLFSLFLALLFVSTASYAQVSPDKAIKKADKAISSFYQDEVKNAAKLTEAMDLIKLAVNDPEQSLKSKTWLIKAKLYKALISKQVKANILNPSSGFSDPEAALGFLNGITKAISTAQKGSEKSAALKMILEGFADLNNFSFALFQSKNYGAAFKTFDTMVRLIDLIKANDGKMPIDNEKDINNLKYMAGISAMQTNDFEATEKYFVPLMESGYDEANIYTSLYQIYAQTDKDKAAAVLQKGREKYPDNSALLFSEINYYLAQGKMDILVEKLELAKKAEPNNPSIYLTLGQVYENIYQTARKDGDMAKADQYFDLAKTEYENATQVDSKYASAYYSIGALYYNKAVEYNKQMNDLPLSAQKEYDALEKKSNDLFGMSLPYFKNAEAVDPNDQNTLIALKEIFARQNAFDLSNEMKNRLNTVLDGGKNESSYFSIK